MLVPIFGGGDVVPAPTSKESAEDDAKAVDEISEDSAKIADTVANAINEAREKGDRTIHFFANTGLYVLFRHFQVGHSSVSSSNIESQCVVRLINNLLK